MDRADLRRALLPATLAEVPFEGWTPAAFKAAARMIGLDPLDIERAFPGGARDAVDYWNMVADEALATAFAALDPAGLKIRERIALAVKMRILETAEHKEAVRRALALLAMPGNTALGLRALYRTVDTIWYAIGDRSTDFSFYTKRALLAAVYGSTVLHWLDDSSDGAEATWAFLDRRIADVMRIPKLTSRLKGLGDRAANPLARLRRRRGRRPGFTVGGGAETTA